MGARITGKHTKEPKISAERESQMAEKKSKQEINNTNSLKAKAIKVKPWKWLLASVNKWFPNYSTVNTDDFSQTHLGKYTEDIEEVFDTNHLVIFAEWIRLNSANMNSKHFSWLCI